MQGSNTVENRWFWRGSAAALILGAAVLHFLYLVHECPLALAPDEAHYWDWSRHLDWSYYSKGPLVALLIRGSCDLFGPLSLSLTGNLALAIRLPAIVCGALLLISLYILTVQSLGKEKRAFTLVALALTLPPVAAVSTLMTIDAPYTACWGWALVFGHLAAVRGKGWAWPMVGLIVGVGILAKYTMALWLPSAGLFLIASPERRVELRRSGFWLACGIAALFCLPIVYWNWQNGWVTVRHVGWQAGVEQRTGWLWYGPLAYVGGQAALLLGVWFVAWATAMWSYRPFSVFGVQYSESQPNTEHRTPNTSYLWCLSAPMFVVFLLASLRTTGQLNWPVTAYLSGSVLAAAWLDGRLREPRARRRVMFAGAAAAACGILLTFLVHYPAVGRPVLAAVSGPPTPERRLPMRRFDPTCRLRGWPALAAAVDDVAAAVRAGGEEPVIAAGTWTLPGELGTYCSGHPAVYTIGVLFGDRSSQYEFWRPNPVIDPDTFRGRTFVLVGCVPAAVRPAFDTIDPSRDLVYAEGGHPIQVWPICVARGFRGFPRADEALRAARY